MNWHLLRLIIEMEPQDEWSGDVGCGVQFFTAGSGTTHSRIRSGNRPFFAVSRTTGCGADLHGKGDDRAAAIYRTMGVYLGYALAQYKDYYPFEHLLLLGRVTTGSGADQMIEKAKEVLHQEFPIKAASIAFHLPGEKKSAMDKPWQPQVYLPSSSRQSTNWKTFP